MLDVSRDFLAQPFRFCDCMTHMVPAVDQILSLNLSLNTVSILTNIVKPTEAFWESIKHGSQKSFLSAERKHIYNYHCLFV